VLFIKRGFIVKTISVIVIPTEAEWNEAEWRDPFKIFRIKKKTVPYKSANVGADLYGTVFFLFYIC